MTNLTLYHNPRCSKSRSALELLEARGHQPTIVRYLDTPPDAAQLTNLLALLGLSARELLRTGEEEYRSLGLDDPNLDDQALIAAMAAHPRLIERPILVAGDRAVIGRPPENVLELLP
ncbi:arsenate reductase (glutaredoxin) [Stutzerimonas chloritidismutans]|uniref:arsenate reductase (glutaredoxin) n=1 Tax=Stutzerimonas chloritidismutans TaxID=203192 RepID=UPI003F17B3A9